MVKRVTLDDWPAEQLINLMYCGHSQAAWLTKQAVLAGWWAI